MFEIILIAAVIIGIVLLIPFLLWRIFLGGALRSAITTFFNVLHEKDSRVDPEAPIMPSQREPISDIMQDRAQQVKQQIPLREAQALDMPQVTVQATPSAETMAVPQAHVPAAQVPTTPAHITQDTPAVVTPEPEPVGQVPPSPIEQPVQPLVEDNSFNQPDPVIDQSHIAPQTPSADTLDAHVPESDSSPYGVRSADHSPGRRLRDKRNQRNSS